jgi:hypothetical protein
MSIMKSYKGINKIILKKKEGSKSEDSQEDKKRDVIKNVLLGLISNKKEGDKGSDDSE